MSIKLKVKESSTFLWKKKLRLTERTKPNIRIRLLKRRGQFPLLWKMNWTTVYQVKYPALALFQILNTMSEHILLNKLLICSRVFIFFVLLFICYYYFISYLTFLTLKILINFYYKSFYPLVNLYSFLVFLNYCKAHLIMSHGKLRYTQKGHLLINKHCFIC